MRTLPLVFTLLLTGLLACQKQEPIVRQLVGGRWEYTYDTVTTTWMFKDSVHMDVQSSQQAAVFQCQYLYYNDSLHIYGNGVGNGYRLHFSATDAFMASYAAFGDTAYLYFVRKP